MRRIAVFASGNGTNAQAIIDQAKSGVLECEVVLVVSDKPNAFALTRAKNAGIDTFSFKPSDFKNKESYESELVQKLKEKNVQLIALAGYMRLIGPTLLQAFEGRIVNIHPSLLPQFPGLDAIGQAMNAGVRETGVTIHLVDSGMDTGPIIAQEKVLVDQDDTIETLTTKIQAVEHRLYPATLREWAESVELEGVMSK
ncbi:phosphoribosylglycinamide formyltransferase [Alkalihalophilus pseudofirmus OF4]|uniref:Phosphoribosylglycinamide formyltransferase n=1 Tax=Alkalihalophilus pseudofirmus (strain ATCC BAA-2126 / JCM 17055 / OF4) TaxID=398511 RepID=D3FSM5_ALKPO|nr:phosphoribosylglycinamide formyltransferase [Alkalihalophilus pseudofirmus]ADC49993.1 phosphoribosylglycinamide formyltransferase [Alkalihalophilus pseudofirmus OF4]